jgi:TRAP-type C4-dicarboxylate transport system permease small subunit
MDIPFTREGYIVGKYIHILFDVIIGFIVKIIGFIMIGAVLLQIAFRYLPFSGMWTDELGRLTFIWFGMLAMAITFIKGMHLSIDYFYLKMKKRTQTILDYIGLLLILVFSGSSAIYGIWLLEFTARQRSPVMQLSFFWFSLSVPVGFGFISLFTLVAIFDRIFFHGRLVRDLAEQDQQQNQANLD